MYFPRRISEQEVINLINSDFEIKHTNAGLDHQKSIKEGLQLLGSKGGLNSNTKNNVEVRANREFVKQRITGYCESIKTYRVQYGKKINAENKEMHYSIIQATLNQLDSDNQECNIIRDFGRNLFERTCSEVNLDIRKNTNEKWRVSIIQVIYILIAAVAGFVLRGFFPGNSPQN